MSQAKNIRIFKTPEKLAIAAADMIVSIAKQSIENKGRFTIALSGGKTPEVLYSILSKHPYSDLIPWDKTDIFWSDERYVPIDDVQNNASRAKILLLDKLSIPSENIHPISVGVNPDEASENYETTIKNTFGEAAPCFDIILLGLGENGHTASIFPQSDVIFEKTRLVKTNYVEEQKMFRITMTPLIINQAHQIIFLVEGENKAEILNTVLNGSNHPEKYPAQIINAENGTVTWFIDEKAASLLKS